MPLVRLGFFDAFLGADTLLFDGDAEGFRFLVDRLRQLIRTGAAPIALEALPVVKSSQQLRVSATQSGLDVGAAAVGEGAFTWQLSQAGWEDVADKLETLTTSSHGHQYLDESGRITVMASRGEYGPEWWSKHA
jgi:hypothetical protein